MRQSIVDEEAKGHTDVGPTDAVDEEDRELQYYTYFGGSSPLTSTTTSTSSSRSASPSARPMPPDIVLPLLPSSMDEPGSTLSGNARKRYKKTRAKSLRKEKRQKLRDADADLETGYTPPSQVYEKYVNTAEAVKTKYDTKNLPTASTGYIALPDEGGGVYSLGYLVGKLGFKLVKAQPG